MKYLLINLTIWAFIALGASLFAQEVPPPAEFDAPVEMQGERGFRFTWSANPEANVTGYLLDFRLVNEDGSTTKWTVVAEVGGRETGVLIVRKCPDGRFDATLRAVEHDPVDNRLLNVSLRSDVMEIPAVLPATPGFKFEITTLASDDLVTWVPIATEIVKTDKPAQFFKSEIARIE